MRLYQFLKLCRTIHDQGDAVIEQFEAIVLGEDLKDQNPNALHLIATDALRPLTCCGDEELEEEAEELYEEIDKHLAIKT